MIHFEVALAIIGIVVTVMGILIGFQITFPSEIQYKASEHLLGFILKYENKLLKREHISFEERQYRIIAPERVEKELQGVWLKSSVILMGVILIGLLIYQTFSWQVNPQTNLIRETDFQILRILLILAVLWILGSIIIQFTIENILRLKRVLKRFKQVADFEKQRLKPE